MNKHWMGGAALALLLAATGQARLTAQEPPPSPFNPPSFGRPISSWAQQGLKDNDPGRRVKALYAIGRLGPEARAAVPDMLKNFRDEKDLSVRYAYRWALRQIDPAAAAAVGAR